MNTDTRRNGPSDDDGRENGKIPAAVYLRRSTDRQEKSLEDQRKEIIRYAAEHGFGIVAEFVDDGVSGTSGETRKGFLVNGEYGDRQNPLNEGHGEPGQPYPRRTQYRSLETLLLRGAGQLVEVLGGLLAKNVDHIIHRDDADEPVLIIDYRNGQKVVP